MMNHPPPEPAETIFTLGHSNHPLETYLELLKHQRIAVVVDVRSSPYCKYSVHFDKEALRGALRDEGIKYLFLGDVLGGRPDGSEFYDAEGYVLYDRVAASREFQRGIDRLCDGVRSCRVAITCGEEDPTDCHRRRLIGRVLRRRGVRVLHIRGDGRVQSEEDLAEEEKFRKTKGQMTLFDTEEPRQWKSTQSVSPEKARPSSSRPSDGSESGV